LSNAHTALSTVVAMLKLTPIAICLQMHAGAAVGDVPQIVQTICARG
jgi:hypothetical protein